MATFTNHQVITSFLTFDTKSWLTEDVKSKSLFTFKGRIWFLDPKGNQIILANSNQKDSGKLILINKNDHGTTFNNLRNALIFELLNKYYDPSLTDDAWSDKFSSFDLVK